MGVSQFYNLVIIFSCPDIIAVKLSFIHNIQQWLIILHFPNGPCKYSVMYWCIIIPEEVCFYISLIASEAFVYLFGGYIKNIFPFKNCLIVLTDNLPRTGK